MASLMQTLHTCLRNSLCRRDTEKNNSTEPKPELKSKRWPPPSPQEILSKYDETGREFAAGTYRPSDTSYDLPTYSLYRLYMHVMLDRRFGLRDEIEYFWNQSTWAVADIPDPHDDNAERYAVLSCIPDLLVEAFNRNIDRCLPRDAPSILSDEDLERFDKQVKKFEMVPKWTKAVASCTKPLYIPHEHGETILGTEDEHASPAFREKNIFIWHPHIHFIW